MSDQFAPRSVLDELRDELGAQFAALPAPRPVTRAPAWRRATVAVAAVILVLAGGMLGRSLLEDTYPISLDGLTIEFNGDLNDLPPGDVERLGRRPLNTQVNDPGKVVTVNDVRIVCPAPAEALELLDGRDPCQAGGPVPAPADSAPGG